MKQDIGFKSYGVIYYFTMMFVVFGAAGVIIFIANKGAAIVFVGILFLAIALVCGVMAVVYSLRPRVLVQIDKKNVYIWRRKGWAVVPLAEIAEAYGKENNIRSIHSGTFGVRKYNGENVKIGNIREPAATRALMEQALNQARSNAVPSGK